MSGSISSEFKPYLDAVAEFVRDESKFQFFKRDPRYQMVLEHVSEKLGRAYLDRILSQVSLTSLELDACKSNDLVGGAELFDFPTVGRISPSTLRYAHVAGELRQHFGSLDGFRVVEIGGGYGGQALILCRLFAPLSYRVFDIEPVNRLIGKYWARHELGPSCSTATFGRENPEDYDLAVSCFAFSEMYPDLQMAYLRKVFSRASRGYLVMNSGAPESRFKNHLSREELIRLLPGVQAFPESPSSGDGNYILIWGV